MTAPAKPQEDQKPKVNARWFEHKLGLLFPRTWAGWKKLWFLGNSRCPIHHKPLHSDGWHSPPYIRYGFCCEGVSYWPVGFIHLLRTNYRSHFNHDEAPAQETDDEHR